MSIRALLLLSLLAAAFAACTGGSRANECTADTDCDGDAICAPDSEGVAVCAAPCGISNPCPLGAACVEVEGGAACFAIGGELEEGDRCDNDVDCKTGACVGEAPVKVCVQTCGDDLACPGDTHCYLDGARRVCLEALDDRADGEDCESSRECLSGFCVEMEHVGATRCTSLCDDGCGDDETCAPLVIGAEVCVPAIANGESCESSEVCAGGQCVEDLDGESICTETCTGDESCGGWFCEVAESGDKVCMPPLDDRAPGEACTTARECASGQCGHFEWEYDNFGDLCAEPCAEDGSCPDGFQCWATVDGPGLCGPLTIEG